MKGIEQSLQAFAIALHHRQPNLKIRFFTHSLLDYVCCFAGLKEISVLYENVLGINYSSENN